METGMDQSSGKPGLFYQYSMRSVVRCPSFEFEVLDNPPIRKLFTIYKPGSSWNKS